MEINKVENNEIVTISVSGRIDTVSAPELETVVMGCKDKAKTLILDFKELDYTSSAGLRVILQAQKMMNKQGEMRLINVNDDIMEIFDITGFLDILTIE